MKLVFLGLSITSSWGNGHATTYRGLVRGLAARGHEVLFLERDQPWYAANRDMPAPPFCRTEIYRSLPDLNRRFAGEVARADVAVVGSYVPQGATVGAWVTSLCEGVTAFYDIDTPVTLAHLADGGTDYLTPELVRRYDLYLSFTGGPTLERLERELGSPCARALHCAVDPDLYRPARVSRRYDLGYLGTYSVDRQPALDALLLEPARRNPALAMIVAGPQYPPSIRWPSNVSREIHLSPREHRAFYGSQRFTLNVTRADMIRAGWSPSVRLFEAAACGTPILTDDWPGLESFFEDGREIVVVRSADDVLDALGMSEARRSAIGDAARKKTLAHHTSLHRAAELERHIAGARRPKRPEAVEATT